LLFAALAAAQPYVISTLTGGVLPPTPARGLDLPIGNLQSVAADAAGNVYFSSLNSVFRVDPNGALTHVAGNSRPGYSGDGGPAISAQLNAFGLAVDGSGNLFIATGNSIRRVTPNGIIVTVAGGGTSGLGDGGPATDAELNAYGVAVDDAGNLFVAGGSRIRKISSAGIITTIAGNGVGGTSGDGGPAVSARINGPGDVAVDRAGNIYFPDNQRVRKVAPSGIVTTVAGNGQCCFSGDGRQATSAELGNPRGVAVDSTGNLFIVDAAPGHIRMVSPSGIITTVAGSGAQCLGPPGSPAIGDGGPATSAPLCFGGMGRVAVDSAGNLFIADTGNQRVRRVSTDRIINTVAGNGIACCFSGDGGPATGAQLNYPWDVAVDGAGNVFIADDGNRRVRKVSPGGTINTLAGNGGSCPFGPNGPSCPPGDGGLATNVPLTNVSGVAADGAGNLFIAEYVSGLRKVAPDGTITTVGNGPRDGVLRVTIDSSGNLYVTDSMGVRIRKISPDGTISAVAGGKLGSSGDGGPATQAELHTLDSDGPGGGLAVDGAGDVFIADTYNNRIRRVSPSGIIDTVAGGAEPFSVASDSTGNLFIADTYSNRIRKVSPDGNITTIAGNGSFGYTGDGGPATSAALSGPTGVAVDGAGNIYVADNGNNAVISKKPEHKVHAARS
jgi:sugar lactone lactonase YvrE